MKNFIGIVGAACGSFFALLVLNLFIYGSDFNLFGGVLFGALVGLALCFLPTRFDNMSGNMKIGALAMTGLWVASACIVLVVVGAPTTNLVSQYVLGTIAMAGIGAISGAAFNAARNLCW